MSEAKEIADAIARSLPDVKRGSLAVFGDIFGGRIDNIHSVRAARAVGAPERLVVEFDDDETLEVWDPADWEISATAFRIRHASKVRWEWFYYGRPKVRENRYYHEHTSVGGVIRATSNVDWYQPSFHPSADREAVELLGLS